MNILLFAPGLFLLFVEHGLRHTLTCLTICLATQVWIVFSNCLVPFDLILTSFFTQISSLLAPRSSGLIRSLTYATRSTWAESFFSSGRSTGDFYRRTFSLVNASTWLYLFFTWLCLASTLGQGNQICWTNPSNLSIHSSADDQSDNQSGYQFVWLVWLTVWPFIFTFLLINLFSFPRIATIWPNLTKKVQRQSKLVHSVSYLRKGKGILAKEHVWPN